MVRTSSFERVLILCVVVLAFGALRPEAAHASGAPTLSLEGDAHAGMMLLGVSAIGFGLLDLAFIAKDRPLPVGLSILQISVAGVLVPLFALTARDSGVAIGAFVSMAWFSGHGIHELVVYPEYARRRGAEVAAEREHRCAVENCTD
jgi:hypothetical protein